MGFMIPIIDGEIYLGKRGTPPHEGLYGPIGGKAEQGFEGKPYFIEKLGGHRVPSIADQMANDAGLEGPVASAMREASEELYQTPVTWTAIQRIGGISDSYKDKDTFCRFFAGIPEHGHFNPAPREITDVQPIRNIAPENIFLMGRVALLCLQNMVRTNWYPPESATVYRGLQDQIPDFQIGSLVEFLSTRVHTMPALYLDHKFIQN